jgi:hypothetical protein
MKTFKLPPVCCYCYLLSNGFSATRCNRYICHAILFSKQGNSTQGRVHRYARVNIMTSRSARISALIGPLLTPLCTDWLSDVMRCRTESCSLNVTNILMTILLQYKKHYSFREFPENINRC